jgi:hypothetical protein
LNANAPPVRRNHAADSHYTPTRLAPALPPIPGSEASAPPTPTPSYRDFVPSRSPPQSLSAVVEHIARTPPSKSPGNASGVSKKSSESGYASAPESTHARRKLKVESPDKKSSPTASLHPSPTTPTKGPTIGGKEIGRPVLNMGAYCRLATKGHAEQTGRICP